MASRAACIYPTAIRYMRVFETFAGRVSVWLAAALVPFGTLPVGTCGCDVGKAVASRADFRSLRDFGSLGVQPQSTAPAARCPHCKPRPAAPVHPCCQARAKAAWLAAGHASGGCCCGGQGCTGGAVCSCRHARQSDPQVPASGNSVKAIDVAGTAVVAAAYWGDRDAQRLASHHPWQLSCCVLTPLERLSTLCRFLI